jgi:hypothetical protein
VLPIDNFVVRGGRLEWEDLGVKYGFTSNRACNIRWASWDNERQQASAIAGATDTSVPNDGGNFLRATIRAGDPKQTVIIHLRRTASGHRVVGIDRTW